MRIPPHIKIKNKVSYEIVFTESFKDPETLGECRFAERQIVLKSGQSKISLKKTFIHEVLHAIEFERKIPIPHNCIYGLEHALYYVIFSNKWEHDE